MKLPNFFRRSAKPDATTAPESSTDLAARVAEAEQAHAAAQRAIESARETFRAARTEKAAEALRQAKADAELTTEILEALRADHAAAVEREAEAQRAAWREEREAERAAVAEAIARCDSLVDAGIEHIRALLEVERARVEVLGEAERHRQRAIELSKLLGEEEPKEHPIPSNPGGSRYGAWLHPLRAELDRSRYPRLFELAQRLYELLGSEYENEIRIARLTKEQAERRAAQEQYAKDYHEGLIGPKQWKNGVLVVDGRPANAHRQGFLPEEPQ